jgi:hypothetical protein
VPVVVVHHHHGCPVARAEAFHFLDGEESGGIGFPGLDPELLFQFFDDAFGAGGGAG